jgi:hypothetical protein
MKRALIVVLALGFGGVAPASGTEQKADDKKPAAEAATAPQQATAPQTGDSPMVAAAKRANRKGRKATNVITNETLSKSGGSAHVTTTAEQHPFVAPKAYEAPRPTMEMMAQQARDAEKRRAAEYAAAQKKKEEAEKQAAAAAAGAAEEGLFADDETPQDANQKPPQF